MLGFGGHIKKENRTPTFVGGPHGPRYAPYPYSPSANPAPGHRRHPDATPTPSQSPAQSAGWGQSPPPVSNLQSSGVLRMPSFRRPGDVESKMPEAPFSGYGPTPKGKVRGMGGQLHDYRGPTGGEGLPDLSNLPGGGGFRHGGGRTTVQGAQQREGYLKDPRWRAGILARQNKFKNNPWQQPTGGGMRGRGAFNNYMQNLRQPMA
jgi:hypothetical protein